MINALIQNGDQTAVLNLPSNPFSLLYDLSQIGIRSRLRDIPINDDEDSTIQVKLFADSDIGSSLAVLFKPSHSLEDANLCAHMVENARPEILEELEQHMSIRFFDMFAGIGGFRSGLEAAGGFECVGHCEIDKYANQAYNAIYEPKGELYFEDARTINPNNLPDIDLICAGFPCQSFSVAGKRLGFADDTRGTLFFEAARIAEAKRPAYLLLENVPGLLSHDGGRTFETILSALVELGYGVEWYVHNSANFGVPQQRRRLYIVASLGGRSTGTVFPLACGNAENLKELISGPQGSRVYETDGVACTQCAGSGGWGGKTVLYFIDMNVNSIITDTARCITARQDSGVSNHRGEHSAVLVTDEPRAILTPDREKVRQQGRRIKEPNEPMFTITAQDRHGVWHKGRIRKLMPIECWRLQGFSDEQFYKAQATGLSDGRLYKMAGNAVSVPVISAIGQKIKEMYNENYNNGSYEFVSIPAVIRSRCTGKLCLGIVTLDLSSSGEHWGTDFLTPYGVVSQGDPDMNADLQKYLRDNFIPYDYWYTADVERDIHISLDGMPEEVADLIAAARGEQQNQEFDYTMKL